MDLNELSKRPLSSPKSTDLNVSGDSASPDPLDKAVLQLATQAAFLQAFAENVIDEERPVEEALQQRGAGENDFGWRAGLQ
jgi:hypothetical protein